MSAITQINLPDKNDALFGQAINGTCIPLDIRNRWQKLFFKFRPSGHLEKYLEINGLLPIPTESSEIPWENYSSFISSEMAPFGLNWKSESKEVKKYYQSEHFAQMQVAFEKFLEKYKEYFQLAADPQGHFEINREKEAEACESQRQAAQYPSTYDWILQNLPSEMRDSLSEEFLSAVLNSAEVREGVQKVVSQIVIEKLGLNAK